MKKLKQPTLLDVDPHARRDSDFYATPTWMTRALDRRRPVQDWGGVCFEPCAGDGAILKALNPALPWVTNDLVPRGGLIPDFLLDATKPESWTAFARLAKRLDVVITNPPFNVALPIVQLAVEHAAIGVAMVLPITWLEPTEDRSLFLLEHPPTRVMVLPRWKFRGVGSAMTTCAWMLWAKQPWFCDPGIEVVTRAERRQLIDEEVRATHAHHRHARAIRA